MRKRVEMMKDRYLIKAKTYRGDWVRGLLASSNSKWYIGNRAGRPLAFEIQPDTICQCTGLKDKNGNLIWENDIMVAHLDDEYPEAVARNYTVLFGNECDDNVNHPAHYQGKNECIDVMLAMFGVQAVKHFCMCNAYKYRFRADKKNGAEDIEKAEWYESKLIELRGGENE